MHNSALADAIRIFEHKVKLFYEWIQCLGFIDALWWCPSLVEMEYFQKKEYFPFKTVIIDNSLQITLGEKKKLPSVIWNFFISLLVATATGIILHFMELVSFSHKYSIWTRGGHHQKVPNETPNIGSIHRMA